MSVLIEIWELLLELAERDPGNTNLAPIIPPNG